MDGIITDQQKYPEFAFTYKRQESFKTWPTNFPIKPAALVEIAYGIH